MSPNPEGPCGKRSVRGRGGRARDILQAARQYKSGDLEAFYQTLTVSTFRNSHLSVSLANPSLPDCPLVGVSHGFEQMTGFARCESLGRNCRFLNRGCPMSAEVRHELRMATKTNRRFVNVLVNRRRNGEVYMNLLNLSSLRVGSCMYLLAIQADVTNADVDVQAKEQLQELDRIVSRIFAASVDVWASQQASNFALSWLGTNVSYAETRLCHRYDKSDWARARSVFVMLISDDSDCSTQLSYSNTFIEVSSEAAQGSLHSRLRRVLSEPDLRVLGAKGRQDLPLDALRDALKHLSPDSDRPWPQLGTSQRVGGGTPEPSRDGAILPASPERMDADGGEDALRSLGSSLHPGQCKPCSFFCYSFSGCTKGKACTYCHMDHPRRRNRRGKKKAKSAGSSSSGNSQGSANSTCADTVDTLQVSPNPTHAMLMPLLDALELLSPLPALAELGPLAKSEGGGDAACAALVATSAEQEGEHEDDAHEDVSLSYSESTLVLALGQWKQVVPFVGGLTRPMVFCVSPPLPQGLSLHRSSGVISGIVTELTPSCGEAHAVTVTCKTGSTSTVVHVLVLESYSDGGSGCSSEQANVNGDDNEDDDIHGAFPEMTSD